MVRCDIRMWCDEDVITAVWGGVRVSRVCDCIYMFTFSLANYHMFILPKQEFSDKNVACYRL